MVKATYGNKVKIRYRKRLKDGEILGTSQDGEILEIRIGSNLVPDIENAVKGMEPGEKISLKISPENTYGERREDLIMCVTKNKLPQSIKLAVGKKINIKKTDGSLLNATIIDIKEEKITLDANHPFAGRPIFFDIDVLEVK